MTSEQNFPKTAVAWLTVILLTIAYIFSYIDRSIIGLLIEPIKKDLQISDEYVGYIIGPAFAIFYATMGLPLGYLSDRVDRTKLLAVGIVVWSIATAMSGFATSFVWLFIARMLVGIGEATLSPCAVSLIGDSFPKERRGKPIAFYSSALSIGAGLASLIGGMVLIWAKNAEKVNIGLIGDLEPWRIVLLIVGIPGLAVATAFYFIKEPIRQAETNNSGDNAIGTVVDYLSNNYKGLVGLVTLVCIATIIAYSHIFSASAFARKFDWEIKDYALINGLITLIIGPLTVWTAGLLVDKWRSKGNADAPFIVLLIFFVIMVFASAIALLMPSPLLAFAFLACSTIGIGGVTVCGLISLVEITAPQFRGQITGFYFMAISLAGLFLGPTSVGILSSRVFGEENVHVAISVVPILFGALPLLLSKIIFDNYRMQRINTKTF